MAVHLLCLYQTVQGLRMQLRRVRSGIHSLKTIRTHGLSTWGLRHRGLIMLRCLGTRGWPFTAATLGIARGCQA